MHYVPEGEPYVARNCRVKIAKQLEGHGLVTTAPTGRLNWLSCFTTDDGKVAISKLVDRLRVRARERSAVERTRGRS